MYIYIYTHVDATYTLNIINYDYQTLWSMGER